MHHSPLRLAVGFFASLVVVTSCRNVTPTDVTNDGRCPQTYEFGNYGCARVVALMDGSALSLPTRYRVSVAIRPVRTTSGWEGVVASDSSLGAIPVTATLQLRPLQPSGDTVTTWVTASLTDWSVPNMSPVIAVAPVDTVRLRVRR